MYTKILARRCQSYEDCDKLEEALLDAKLLVEQLATEALVNAKDLKKAHESVKRIEVAHAAKLEAMKTEALGKLKELGNSILGNFGMSLGEGRLD